MKIAVLSDIHGNADALTAVLAHARAGAPDAIVNLGDCFSGPLDIRRTHDILGAAAIDLTVRGNHDRALLHGEGMDSWDRMSHPQLTSEMRDWLASLPFSAQLDEVYLCHATPQSDTGYWADLYTHDGVARRADLTAIEAMARDISARVLLCGHTHVPRAIHLSDGRLLVNPGSVGAPGFADDAPRDHRRVSSGTPFASYATLDRRQGTWSASLHLVPYDTGPAIAMAQRAGCADWVAALSCGWV